MKRTQPKFDMNTYLCQYMERLSHLICEAKIEGYSEDIFMNRAHDMIMDCMEESKKNIRRPRR